jgi:hypothetical protein
MPVAINPVSRAPQTDPLEKLATALNIAKTGYGIYADTQALDAAKQKQASDLKTSGLTQQKMQGEISGEMTPKDLVQYGIKDVSDTEKPGYIPVLLRQPGEDTPMQKFIKPKSGESALDDLIKMTSLKHTQAETAKINQDLLEGKKVSGDQANAATFAKRMGEAENVFSNLSSEGSDGTGVGTMIQRSSLYPSLAETDAFKKRDQAERNFVNAVLRRESGAAISKDEFTSAAKQYFPQPGDPQDVLAQKSENRRTALQGMQLAAGKAMQKLDGVPASLAQAPATGKPQQAAVPPDIQAAAAEKLKQRRAQAAR